MLRVHNGLIQAVRPPDVEVLCVRLCAVGVVDVSVLHVDSTGLEVEPVGIVGIYSDPKHVFSYDDGEVRQEFSICLACRIVAGDLAASDESYEVAFHAPSDITGLPMVESIRLRVEDYLAGDTPVIR